MQNCIPIITTLRGADAVLKASEVQAKALHEYHQ